MAEVVRQVFINGKGTVRIIRLRYGDMIHTFDKSVPFKGGYNYVVCLNGNILTDGVYLLSGIQQYTKTLEQAIKQVKQTYEVNI